MKIDFTWHHADRSEAIEDLLYHKLEKLERHGDHIHHIHVIFEHDKKEHTVKAIVHYYGKEIHAHDVNVDMYKAIDQMAHKLIRQVEEYKEKMRGH